MYECRVYYEDTDVGGVVYHANYIKFCERARSQLFFDRGLSPHNEAEFFVVKKIDCDFVRPALFGDILEISTKLVEKKAASMKIEQNIYTKGELLFTGSFTIAYLKNKRPSRIPKELYKIFEEVA